MNNEKVILVSGASSGLGQATAQLLFEKGYTVYAGARSYKAQTTERKDGGVLHKVYLDVTDEQTIGDVIKEIVRQEKRLDVLINCAAIIVLGSVEDLSMDEFEGVMNTNFYGTVRICRHALPYMRENKKGLIINFSSGAGLVGIPFQSAYSSSKFAIEGFSETLRWEVKNFGIDVVLMEPGDSNAGSKTYRLHAKKAGSELSAYSDAFKTATEKIASDEANGADSSAVAQRINKIINNAKPAIRYKVVRLTERLLPLKMILPSWFTEWVVLDYYKLNKKKLK